MLRAGPLVAGYATGGHERFRAAGQLAAPRSFESNFGAVSGDDEGPLGVVAGVAADRPSVVVQFSASEGLVVTSVEVVPWCFSSTSARALHAWMKTPFLLMIHELESGKLTWAWVPTELSQRSCRPHRQLA